MEKIMKYIDAHRAEAVAFLQKMISLESTFVDQGVYGNEGNAQVWLEKQVREWNFETSLFEPDNREISTWPDYNPGHHYDGRPNLVAISRGAGGGRSLLLNGHIDTVPLDDPAKWTYPPLSAQESEGKIYGRGACDMKAGVAAMILATKYLNDLNIPRRGDVIIESVVDEEGGGNGTLACVAKGIKADAAIVTEPTELAIYSASRGVFLLKVTVEGKPSHACFKWNGVNAIEKGIKIANALSDLERRWLAVRKHPQLPSPTITLGEIAGGISAATVPGTCTMKFDIKYLPSELNDLGQKITVRAEDVRREVEACIQNVCAGDEWLREHPPKLDWYLSVMPHEIDDKAEILNVVQESVQSVLGNSRISGLPSGADARHLQNNGGIPTILFGPGSMKNAHSIDEYVEIDEYINCIKILAKAIAQWTA